MAAKCAQIVEADHALDRIGRMLAWQPDEAFDLSLEHRRRPSGRGKLRVSANDTGT